MMKSVVTVIAAAFFSFSFYKPIEVKLEKYEIAEGDTLHFSHGPDGAIENFEGTNKCRTFDGKKYDISVNNTGNLIISKLAKTVGKSSSELNIIHGKGFITRIGDTLAARISTKYNKFYLIELKTGVIDSITNEFELKLVSKNTKNEYCPNRVNTFSVVSIVALPTGVKYKKIYKPVHSEKTIGQFTYFSIFDSQEKRKFYPHGQYILVGGNSQVVVK